MERRNFLIGIGATSVAGSALLGSGAFSRIESDRNFTIEVVEDPDAYLGLDACDSDHGYYVELDDDGHMYVDVGESSAGGEGTNSDSRTWFDDVFQICNQGTEAVYVWVEEHDEWPRVESGSAEGQPRVDFYLEDGESILGADEAEAIDVGECGCVGIETNTYGIDATDGETLLAQSDDVVTLVADVEAPEALAGEAIFEVADLDPSTVTVKRGETFDVSATVTNTGDAAGEGAVDLSLVGDEVDSELVSLDPGADAIVSYESVDTADLEEGEYTYAVASVDDQQSGVLTVEPDEVETIAADPTDVPPPVDWDEPRHHEIELRTEEHVVEIEDGVTHQFMTFNGQVPGPMIRVRRGDTVQLTFDVPEALNDHVHNVDFHAVYGPGGGAVDTTVVPGEGPVEIEFTLEYPGAHIYHCAPGLHDYHISTGMFGIILVEPEDGLPEVDREFYFGQHELYTDGDAGEEGHHEFDFDAAAAENPTYVLFNGEVGRFSEGGEAGPLHAETGETVRLFWCNGGPNHVSSPHPIGNVFKRWYDHGDVVNEPMKWVEGSTLGAGMVAFGDMELPVPGPIYLVDHALSRVVHKGLGATIEVEGEPVDEDIFNPDP